MAASAVLDGTFMAGTAAKGAVSQRGNGGYYFCGEYNSSLSLFNLEYSKLANSITGLIVGYFRELSEDAFFNPLLEFEFTTEKLFLGRVVRSISSNFITMESNPESKLLDPLRKFVRDPLAEWPENVRMLLTVSWGTHIRNFGPFFSTDGSCFFETAFPPFSSVLLLDGHQELSILGVDITNWCELGVDEAATFAESSSGLFY